MLWRYDDPGVQEVTEYTGVGGLSQNSSKFIVFLHCPYDECTIVTSCPCDPKKLVLLETGRNTGRFVQKLGAFNV